MKHLKINCSSDKVKALHPLILNKIGEILKISSADVDTNLIDYALLLIENGHEKDKIKSDLNAFLPQKKCTEFVEWLWELLEPISNEKSKQNSEINENSENTKKSEKNENIEKSISNEKFGKFENKIEQNNLKNENKNEKSEEKTSQKSKIFENAMNAINIMLPPKNNLSPKQQNTAQNDNFSENLNKNDENDQKMIENDQKMIENDQKIENGEKMNFNGIFSKKTKASEIPRKMRKQINCQYYPNCMRGNKCDFYHPNQICKYYPNCSRGASCIYLHVDHPQQMPPGVAENSFAPLFGYLQPTTFNSAISSPPECFFGMACVNPQCQFSHPNGISSDNNFSSNFTPDFSSNFSPNFSSVFSGSNSAKSSTPCRFGAGCMSVSCPFGHPERSFNSALNSDQSALNPALNLNSSNYSNLSKEENKNDLNKAFNSALNSAKESALKIGRKRTVIRSFNPDFGVNGDLENFENNEKKIRREEGESGKCRFDKACQKINCNFEHPERDQETKLLISNNK